MGNVGIKSKTHLVMAGLLVLALTLGIAYATPVEISKSVPGSITLANILPLGDVDGDGKWTCRTCRRLPASWTLGQPQAQARISTTME